jgi:hypothetical protein
MRVALVVTIVLAGCTMSTAGLVHSDAGMDGGVDAGPAIDDAGPLDAGIGAPDAGEDGGPDAGVNGDAGMDGGDGGTSDGGDGGSSDGGDGGSTDGGDAGVPPSVQPNAVFASSINNSWAVANADFNRDGFRDFVQAGSYGAVIFYGQPDGGLLQGSVIDREDSVGSVAAADLDGDGFPDFVLAGSTNVVVEINQRDGSFAQSLLAPSAEPDQVAIADFNGDGRPDIAECNIEALDIFFALDDGGFAPALPLDAGLRGCSALTVADFNHDGFADIAFIPWAEGPPGVMLSGGADGTFVGPTFPVNYADDWSVISADLNGDGLPDLVLGASEGTMISMNLGDGAFGPQTPVVEWSNFRPVSVADLNGDGLPDLIVASGTLCNSPPDSGSVLVLVNDGDGGFIEVASLDAGTTPRVVALLGQEDGGVSDLAVCSLCTPNVLVFPNPSP